MAFLDIRTVLEKITDLLLEMDWTPEGKDTEKVFDEVAFYWSTDVSKALKDLYLYEGAKAIIVPNDFEHSSVLDPDSVEVSRILNLDILFTARSYKTAGGKAEAYVGMKKQSDGSWDVDNSKLGMLDIALAVVEKMAGQKLGGFITPMKPNRAVPLNLQDRSGIRASFLINFTVEMGQNDFQII